MQVAWGLRGVAENGFFGCGFDRVILTVHPIFGCSPWQTGIF